VAGLKVHLMGTVLAIRPRTSLDFSTWKANICLKEPGYGKLEYQPTALLFRSQPLANYPAGTLGPLSHDSSWARSCIGERPR
jgi:hypothetical protein